ncbi:Helix-turn-helix domain-containing protein [Cohnella sp. OV330]|uniref:helix-turn-helix transcriptional regulator n=1 Tax=Cohnella sp. OV330 TaxID=1855288 RepID=UPI0008E04B12|nr:response regulator transcription factor [Cohnella sp. OV330]SFB27647.1 Helix-turn-helix domain-containing protein [Cohnella sp. OV330]
MNLLLAEDELRIGQGFRELIEAALPGFFVFRAAAASGEEAHEATRKQLTLSILVTGDYDTFAFAGKTLRFGALDGLPEPFVRSELVRMLGRMQEAIASRTEGDGDESGEGASVDRGGAGQARLLIRQVKELVSLKLDRDISLQSLAGEVYLHPKYLSDLFKRETGVNLTDYVTEQRIAKAKRLLRQTTLKIGDVASMCGLPNQKYFASLFKRRTGCTPTAFREG